MRIALILPMIAVFTGCGVELLTTTAIQGELQAKQLQAVQGQVGRVAESTGKINLQRAIDTYYAEKGKYPATLQELSPGWIPSVPTRTDGTPYGYDGATGKLLDGPVAAAVSSGPTDEQKMAQIREAINKYGTAVKFYPPSLQALVPNYLAQIPKASNGQDFLYNPQNGALINPANPTSQPQPGSRPQGVVANRGGGVGGSAGPMGETMTGIAVSNQLDSMSNAGSAAAGGYAHRGLDSATQQHNQQQEKALQDIGN